MPVFIKTFGCKTNYADSVELARKLAQKGVACSLLERAELPKDGPSDASVCAVNTCAVTAEAVAKARRFCRRILRVRPDADVIVTGCGARTRGIAAEFSALGVTVLPNTDEVLALLAAEHKPAEGRGATKTAGAPISRRSRYFLKVQDGCDAGCRYCIIPYVRTRESKSWREIGAELAAALEAGTPEVVLTGINLGLYRSPDTGWNLAELVENALELMPDGCRLRVSSVEPEHVTERLMELFSHPRMCPHLHLPLQSGSKSVLAAMGRKYTPEEYSNVVSRFRYLHPWGAVTTDVMVAYPAETPKYLDDTLAMVRTCEFERVHIFRFSARPGTTAAKLKPLPSKEVSAREKKLFEVAAVVSDRSLARYLNRECDVAREEEGRRGLAGYGEAYQRVEVRNPTDHPSSLVRVRLAELKSGVFRGDAVLR